MHDAGNGGSDPAGMDRRGFLGWSAGALAALVGISGGFVALVYATAPALRKGDAASDTAWSAVPDAGAAAEPTRHTVDVATNAGWAETRAKGAIFLDRGADGAVTAFSARCPHEGCQIDWRAEETQYVCPCHASKWTRAGERVAGPTKRGLDPIEVRAAADGGVEVRYVSYALDTPERVRVG
jgi:Rieske Fe-S protein